MKVFTWLALLAMVHATHGEASHEDHEERKLAHAEVREVCHTKPQRSQSSLFPTGCTLTLCIIIWRLAVDLLA